MDARQTNTDDGWASYDRFWRAIHQTCLAHLLRRCHELLERATRGAVIFPRKVKALLQEALEVRDQRDARKITVAVSRARADALDARMEKALEPIKSNPANERLAKHLWKHRGQLFTFLRHPGIDAAKVLADAVRRANSTDPTAIRDAIAQTKDFPGAGGQITIDENHNARKPIVILEIEGGKTKLADTIQP